MYVVCMYWRCTTMKTRSEVWEEYNRLQEILKANIEKEVYDDELVGKINALYWVLEHPLG